MIGIKTMNLPDFAEIYPICNGRGEHLQVYNARCGGGIYQTIGPCDFCKPDYMQ